MGPNICRQISLYFTLLPFRGTTKFGTGEGRDCRSQSRSVQRNGTDPSVQKFWDPYTFDLQRPNSVAYSNTCWAGLLGSDRYVPYPKGLGRSTARILGFIRFDLQDQVGQGNTTGKGRVSLSQTRLYPKGRAPALPFFLEGGGAPSYSHTV